MIKLTSIFRSRKKTLFLFAFLLVLSVLIYLLMGRKTDTGVEESEQTIIQRESIEMESKEEFKKILPFGYSNKDFSININLTGESLDPLNGNSYVLLFEPMSLDIANTKLSLKPTKELGDHVDGITLLDTEGFIKSYEKLLNDSVNENLKESVRFSVRLNKVGKLKLYNDEFEESDKLTDYTHERHYYDVYLNDSPMYQVGGFSGIGILKKVSGELVNVKIASFFPSSIQLQSLKTFSSGNFSLRPTISKDPTVGYVFVSGLSQESFKVSSTPPTTIYVFNKTGGYVIPVLAQEATLTEKGEYNGVQFYLTEY